MSVSCIQLAEEAVCPKAEQVAKNLKKYKFCCFPAVCLGKVRSPFTGAGGNVPITWNLRQCKKICPSQTRMTSMPFSGVLQTPDAYKLTTTVWCEGH